MSLFKPDAPPPPNPIATGAAQTSTNVSTAVANSMLNNVNQVTPTGSLTYDQTGSFSWTDPTSGASYTIPRFTATTSLSPQQQQIQSADQAAQLNLANTSQEQSSAVRNLLNTPFNPTQGSFNAARYMQQNPDVLASYNTPGYARPGETQDQYALRHYTESGQFEGRGTGGIPAPGAGDPNAIGNVPGAQSTFADAGQQQLGFADVGQQQGTFGDAGDVTRTYGPNDFSADRSAVEQALYQRMDPQLQLDRSNLEARLADQGIQYGSPAYQSAMDQFNRQLTDTRLAITQTAGQEQQRMQQEAQAQAAFQNAAQQQAYQQAQGRGEFANAAQAQNFAQAQQRGQFYNAAQTQQFGQNEARGNFFNNAQAQNLAQQQSLFNARNTNRQQYLQEQYQQRNQPINEISSLLSGSQVTNPQFVNTPNSQIPTTDIAGLINNRFSQDMSIYNAQNQNFQQLMGGIFGAMGGLVKSDRREKENIERMGTVFASSNTADVDSDEIKRLPIYEYSYKDDPASTRHIGPMAQDVEKVDPRAVKTRGGKKYIDTTRMASILKAA